MSDDSGSRTHSGTQSGVHIWFEHLTIWVLVLIPIGGIAVSDFSLRHGFWYWLAVAPIYALISLFLCLSRTRHRGQRGAGLVVKVMLHWAAMAITVLLIYILQSTGRMNNADAGLVALLVLALTTFLAGIHFDWRFGVLGVVLGATAACVALLEEYLWVLLIIAIGAGAIVLFWKRLSARN